MPSQYTQVDLSTRNTLSEQLANINLNQENIVTILSALNDISTGNVEKTTISIQNQDGTSREVTLYSNAFISSEIQRLNNTLEALQNLDPSKNTTIVDESGQHRQIFVGSYSNAPTGDVTKIEKVNTVAVDYKSLIWKLMFPSTAVVFTLPNDFIFVDKVYVKTFRCENEESFSKLSDAMSYAEAYSLSVNNTIQGTWFEDVYDTNIRVQRYYGSFDILSIDTYNTDGTITIQVLDTHYSDINSIAKTRELYANDVLVSKSGNSKYKVISVDHYTNKLIIEQTYGIETLEAGIGALQYVYEIEDETRELHIPIHGSEKSICFLSPVNPQTSASGEFTTGYLIDTSTLVVYESGIATPFDTYYTNKVVNIGSYLEQLVSENTIPYSQGVKPDKPTLSSDYLSVVQINKHLSDNSTVQKIENLANEKEKLFADITAINAQIAEINSRINAGRYRSIVDRKADENRLQTYLNQKSQLSTTYASLVSDIASKVNEDDLSSFTPKFRIRGFFPIQTSVASSTTRAQQIIKCLIQYRYCTPNTNDSNALTLPFKDELGNEIHGTFSAWVTQDSPTLHKVKNLDGSISWQANNVESGDEININQIDIPIKSGESVEIRVKTLSEAGYPVTYTESDWSDIVRVDFPASLQDFTSISDTVDKNKKDAQKVELEQMLTDIGIDDHLFTSFKEQDKYFAHTSHVIASGFKSSEQSTISLFDYLVTMNNQIKALQEQLNRSSLNATITIEDEDGNSYSVQNFTTIKLNAGAYSSIATAGLVVRKTFYIKITNNNGSAIDILSPVPGNTQQNVPVSSDYYIPFVSITTLSNEDSKVQYNGQVIAFRKKDVSGSSDDSSYLYVSSGIEESDVILTDDDINPNVTLNTEHDVIDYTGKTAKLAENVRSNLVVLSINHTAAQTYLNDKTAENLASLQKVFDQLKKHNYLTREDTIQPGYPYGISFSKDDEYAMGANSTGAKLYPVISNVQNIQVSGNKATDTKTLQSGETNAIIIPVVFEYRLSDARGYVLGTNKQTTENIFLSKKIGVDMQLNNSKFQFDIEVACSLLEQATLDTTKLNSIIDKINANDVVTPSIN